MWHSQAGLTAEIGSWLLFDRYIIPAALDLFTKQHTEPQESLPRKKSQSQGASARVRQLWCTEKSKELDGRGRLGPPTGARPVSVILEVPAGVSEHPGSRCGVPRRQGFLGRFGESTVACTG